MITQITRKQSNTYETQMIKILLTDKGQRYVWAWVRTYERVGVYYVKSVSYYGHIPHIPKKKKTDLIGCHRGNPQIIQD